MRQDDLVNDIVYENWTCIIANPFPPSVNCVILMVAPYPQLHSSYLTLSGLLLELSEKICAQA